MKFLSLLPAAAFALAATGASATVYNFSVVSTVQNDPNTIPNYQFSIDDATATFIDGGFYTEVDNVFTTGQRPFYGSPGGDVTYNADYSFYTSGAGGAFDDGTADHAYFGAQLFTGTTAAPVFTPGTYNLYYGSTTGTPDAVLTISGPAGPVPEAASWAMMLLGLGMVGGVMRHRARVSRVTYA